MDRHVARRPHPRDAAYIANIVGAIQANAGVHARAAGARAVTAVGKYATKIGSKRSRPNDKVVNKKELATHSGSTPVVASGKKIKPKKKVAKRTNNKAILKVIDRRMLHPAKILMSDIQTNQFEQKTSAANRIGWSTIVGPTVTTFRARLNYRTLDSDSGVTSIKEIDADHGGYIGKKFYFRDTHNLHLKNNTNSPCEVVIYLLKCTDYTNVGPLTEINEMRKAAFSDAGVLPRDEDFNQYYSIPRVNKGQRKWIIHKKWTMDLSGGEESRLFVNIPQVMLDPAVVFETGDATYFKGMFTLIMRQQGKVTHDKTTTTLLGIANTEIDIMMFNRLKSLMQSSLVVQPIRQTANIGVALTTPIMVEPELVGLNEFKDN